MQKMNVKRLGSWAVIIALLLTMLPTAAFAADNMIYTDMNYKGVSTGSENQPFSNFEDAVANAEDGDTIVIKGKGYANAKDEHGTTPLIINKRVTITGEGDAVGELYVRAGGIILGADVTMRNVELNLANRYHNAIFVNGYHLTAENVTRGSGSREVHLFAGIIGAGTQVTAQLPAAGTNAALTLTNSQFGNIYAGGVNTDLTGDVTVTATGSTVGTVYGSGADERAPDGNWFDITEPPAPTANAKYAVIGSVSVVTDARSVTTVDAKGSGNVAVTVNKAVESRVLTLTGVKTLSVNGGTATVAALDAAAAVTLSGDNATLDISKLADPALLGSLSGSGKLIMDKMQTLNIAGVFNGKWTFETSGGFKGKSGVAEYGHTYITSNGGDAALSFTRHDTQSTMTLDKQGNNWATSAAPKSLSYVTDFTVQDSTVTTTTAEINKKDNIDGTDVFVGNAEFQVSWSNPSQSLRLTIIPLRYEITWNRQSYQVDSAKDDENGFYSAHFGDAHMLISADDTQEDGKSLLRIEPLGDGITAGVYQFSVFAPNADGGEIQQNFTLIVTDDSATQASTTVTVTVPDVCFGDALQPNIEVKAGDTVIPDAEVEYYINGWKAEPSQLVAQMFFNCRLGTNELRVVYKGSDDYAPSVGTTTFNITKATNTKVNADLSASSGKIFDGKAVNDVSLGSSTVYTKDTSTWLGSDAKVSIEYRLNGQTVKEAVFPGEYTIVLVVAEGDMYEAFEQDAWTITIRKAEPTVTVNAVDQGNGMVELTAEVEGVVPYAPTGKVSFLWGKETLETTLVNGKASYIVNDAEASTRYTYKATYVPAADDPYYNEAMSAEKTITTSGAPTPGKGTVTADLFDFNAPVLTYSGNDQSDAVRAAVRLKNGLAGKVGEITVIIMQGNAEIAARNAGDYDIYVTTAEGSEYAALTQPLKLGSMTIAPKTITAADFTQGENSTYNGTEQAAPITTKNGLVAGQDYDLTGTTALTDVAAADATVTATGKGNYTGTVNFTWNLKKAKPSGEPVYTAITGSGKTLADAKLAQGTIQPTGGTLRWVLSETTPVQANTKYAWEYILANANYENLTGSIELWHQQSGGSGSTGGGGGGAVSPSTFSVTAGKTENGTVSVNPAAAAKGAVVTITVKPDSGYKLASLTVRDSNGNEIAVTKNADDKYTFVMPSSKVSINASFSKGETNISFVDVAQNAYYYDAVKWAVEQGITEGTSVNTFSPNASCTRAQMVTFLWRAAGSPAPKGMTNPFKDVSSTDYFYNAVLWAVENGITSGVSADTFAPNATVNRAQTVTFLYQAAGSPTVSGGSFSDVSANAYYANAVAWAAQINITSGTGNGKFSPGADCTRGQIVTFLYHANH